MLRLRRTLNRLQRWSVLLRACSLHVKCKPTARHIGVDDYVIAMQHLSVEDLHRQRVLHHALDRPLERTRTIRAIVTFSEDHLLRRWRELDRDPAVGQHLAQVRQPEIDDANQLRLLEWP